MNVSVVLTDAMGGQQLMGVYRLRHDAEEHAKKNVVGRNTRVLDVEVLGDQADPNVVYSAETLDRTMDVHNFEGVYGNIESARRAAGPKGLVLTRTL